jgi:NUDIX domain
MLITFPLPMEVIDLDQPAPVLPPDLEREVERIWQEASAQDAPRLFNGQIFSLDESIGNPPRGRFIEYRRFYAQFRYPELFSGLKVRALSVCALLVTKDGVVWGQRGADSAQKPGCWELIPCGAVDLTSRTPERRLDLRTQILSELNEELGLEARNLVEATPIAFFTDTTHHIHFYAFKLFTELTKTEITSAFEKGIPREHSRLKIVPNSQLDGFISTDALELGEVSRYLLAQAGLL